MSKVPSILFATFLFFQFCNKAQDITTPVDDYEPIDTAFVDKFVPPPYPGLSWTMLGAPSQVVRGFADDIDGGILLASDSSVYKSIDSGLTWTTMCSFPGNSNFGGTGKVTVAPEGTIYASLNGGFVRSTDRGITWTPPDLSLGRIDAFLTGPNGFVLAGMFDKPLALRSTDYGANWSRADSGLPQVFERFSFATDSKGRIYTSTPDGIYCTDDRGAYWKFFAQGSFDDIAVNPWDHLFAVGLSNTHEGVSRYTNKWSFSQIFAGDELRYPYSIRITSNGLIIVGCNRDVFCSTDNGQSWSNLTSYLTFTIGSVQHLFITAGGFVFASSGLGQDFWRSSRYIYK